MPLSDKEAAQDIDSAGYFDKLQEDQPFFKNQCQFLIPFDRTKSFKAARKLLEEIEVAKNELRLLDQYLDPKNEDFELARRKNEYLQEEENLKALSCRPDGPFKMALRTHDNIENILKVLKEFRSDYHIGMIDDYYINPFKESYSHYMDYKKSVDSQRVRAKRERPVAKARLEKALNSKEYKELTKRYTEKELKKIREKEISKPPRNYVMVFEGTGGYSPKKAKKLKLLHAQSQYREDSEYKKKASDYLSDDKHHEDKVYLLKTGDNTWPGMIYGPLTNIVTEIDSDKNSGTLTNWNYYDSESQGKGRNRAEECLEEYQDFHKHVYGEGSSPTITIIGHSSGGFSALKMANRVSKKYPKARIKLVTIDPVIPMEIAAVDGLNRIVNPFSRGRIGDHSKYGIFKVVGKNIEAINFYQNQDKVGITEQVPVPILGSKVEGSKNHYIDFPEGSFNAKKAHGAITYDKRVMKIANDLISP